MVPANLHDNGEQRHLFLIDGFGFVFRAFHSIRELTNPEGTPVNALYGFTNMLMKLKGNLQENSHHMMLVVLDSGRNTFRNEIYSDYKANRPPPPDELRVQFPLIRDAVKALELPIAAVEGYEADDIIATYTKQAREQGIKVTIVSSDKDLMQLVGQGVEMYDAMKDKRIGPEEVAEKFGVEPQKVLDILALMGDSSDNIPGVPGIGPKTAADLIQQFGDLEGILANTAEIPQKKRRETLEENAEQARLSKKLAALCYDTPVEHTLEQLEVQPYLPESMLPFLQQHGFKSLIQRMSAQHGMDVSAHEPPAPPALKAEDVNIPELTDDKALQAWLDTHVTTQLAIIPLYEKTTLKGLSLASSAGEGAVIKAEQQSDDLFAASDPFAPLKPYIQRADVQIITHDGKALQHLLGDGEAMEDIALMAYALDGTRNKIVLDELAQAHLDAAIAEGGEACAAMALHRLFRQRLFAEKQLRLFEHIERPLAGVLLDMERTGITVDSGILSQLSNDFATQMAALEKEIYALANAEFNIGSPKQLGEVLFDQMGIEGGKKSKSGAYSTGAEVLEKLAAEGHTIADKVLAWRMLSKLTSTYTDALPKEIKSETGRIHTTFQMTATSTGRLSSQHPNLQNIPIRTEEGRKIRTAFVAAKGCTLIGADYSQIELRLLAHMADIDVLKQAFQEGQDIHALTASQVFGVKLEDMDGDTRRKAKAINFGIIYGQSAHGLAQGLGISRGEAKEYIDSYFTQYPGIRTYMEAMKEKAHEQGYVETLYGRKCYLNGIDSKNGALRQFAERAAINAPLQGTAADIIKHAMVRLHQQLAAGQKSAKMLLQVHDELILEAPEDMADEIATLATKVMEGVIDLSVPLTVEAQIGHHWGEVH